ncbi:GNAT family N-acetyltransferase [Brachybacterium sp. AOP25-B2-12]|uniref:GNAT family N-acetyltransferase n=1 Tax=Brachybacterium sp. AOP25-B2-12 TaxID=3457710 RepID=UPI0040334041
MTERSTLRPGAVPRRVGIRRAVPADAQAAHTVVEAAYRGTGTDGVGWTTEAHLVEGARSSVRDIEDLIADPAVTVLVAERPDEGDDATDRGRLVGCCYVHRPRAGGGPAEFGLFAVDPRVQSGGIGRALLKASVDQVRADGASTLEITVLQSRPELRAWYERRGFVATGESRPFPGHDQRLRIEGLGMDVLVRRLDV